jgi:hypothetical protein
MPGIAGLRGTGDWATDERPKNFREFILFRNPNGNTPITALSSRVQKDSVDDAEFSWWDEPVDIVRLQVNAAFVAGDTTITVDSADNSVANPGNVWGEALHLKPGDLLLVEPTTDQATLSEEVMEVVSIISATSFTVKRGASGTTAASISDNDFLFLIGSVYAEGTGAPKATSRNPTKYTNFTQIFKTTYELTGTAVQTKTRTGDPVQNDRRRKAFDHARQIELAMLWGQKSETTGDNGKPKRTMDGLRKFIPASNVTIFSGTTTMSLFLDAVAPVFDFDSPAGDTRMLFCGNTFLNNLNKMVQKDAAVRMDMGDRISLFGMNFREYIMPQGRVLLKTHPLMNRHGLYQNAAFIIDFSSIRYRPMKNRDTKFMDNIQNKDEDLRRGQWMTEMGIEVRFGGLTNGYLANITP